MHSATHQNRPAPPATGDAVTGDAGTGTESPVTATAAGDPNPRVVEAGGAGAEAAHSSEEDAGAETEGFRAAAARRRTAARFARQVAELSAGAFDCPLPGSGRTAERFAALTAVAEQDLCLARLVEGHVDAVAILAELGGPPPGPGERWGVWAAESPGEGLTATRTDRGWTLSGLKPYCSGAHSCTHALVTANAGDGRRLFAVRTGAAGDGTGCRPVAGSWQALGMAGSDTPDVRFHTVPAEPVGAVARYLTRPGFQHGGIGVAACWYGGARAVAAVLVETASRRGPDPLTDAHLGAVDMRLHAAGAVLRQAAAEIDRDPYDTEGAARVRGLRVRAFVESVCADVLTHVGRATGAGPLCHDERHARNTADLAVYIRQHHAERSLAELGGLAVRKESS
ncbi:acyl-CoA dehydrogenase [Actinacidiphila sp. ITFR-21]|uniref:acyl-CoA dehydrogenase n=1 Tax=Actinacidiphila sp. ITFR-21 TaxID=3075199 RepID=UPI0028891040|nr:acyl-CoA dehydrogenase [Streptomyces sp. ITFR-21]WNI19027.1 acyl-CoA dehydrogenase [Streptomyces sp. ITFR-21]